MSKLDKFIIQCRNCGSTINNVTIVSFKGTRSAFIPEDQVTIECKGCGEKETK